MRGEDSKEFSLRHFEVDNWSHNTDGTNEAKTYTFTRETKE